jgi:hypothetical protein
MNVSAASKARNTARATSPDEAVAHTMSVRIVYDPTKDEYQRVQ